MEFRVKISRKWLSTFHKTSRYVTAVRTRRTYNTDTKTTSSENEIQKFRNLSNTFWDAHGPFKPLHALNKLRVSFVRDGILTASADGKAGYPPLPLEGFSVLDVGCGGGILSESLAKLGAYVKGIDPCGENIVVATQHAAKYPDVQLRLSYEAVLVEDLKRRGEKPFDAIVASEVIEHVDDPQFFVQTCSELLKPGGSLFITTINRTTASRLVAITAAESVLRVIPQGTHDWDKFITVEELTSYMSQSNCQPRLIHGMLYNPLTNNWSWVSYTGVNYAVHAIKKKTVPDFAAPPQTDIEDVKLQQGSA